MSTAGREIYAQFFLRIKIEMSNCILGEFSKLKTLQGSSFSTYRGYFNSMLQKFFIVPSYTFDNVTGNFPIGFKIWDLAKKNTSNTFEADIFDEKGLNIGTKTIYTPNKKEYINSWISSFKENGEGKIGFLCGTNGNDFQQNGIVYILNKKEQMANPRGIWVTGNNLFSCSIYYSVRHVMEATWLNDRDQFLYPNDGWKTDKEFQSNCLVYALFNNNIQSKHGTNHWIPFTEKDVNAKDCFESHFMTDFIAGKIETTANQNTLFDVEADISNPEKITFSATAKKVMDAGRELWSYYHTQPNANVNASFYDIKEHFQGRNKKNELNNKSNDEQYNKLISTLRERLKDLAKDIEPKVYEYGFLK